MRIERKYKPNRGHLGVFPAKDYGKGTYITPEQMVKPEHTRRNEPCPCGSGKKYKRCCWKPLPMR